MQVQCDRLEDNDNIEPAVTFGNGLPVISSHGRFVTIYGRFVTVSSSHPSYLMKGVLGVQHFIITMITPWANHQSNCRDCLHVLKTEPLSALIISKL